MTKTKIVQINNDNPVIDISKNYAFALYKNGVPISVVWDAYTGSSEFYYRLANLESVIDAPDYQRYREFVLGVPVDVDDPERLLEPILRLLASGEYQLSSSTLNRLPIIIDKDIFVGYGCRHPEMYQRRAQGIACTFSNTLNSAAKDALNSSEDPVITCAVEDCPANYRASMNFGTPSYYIDGLSILFTRPLTSINWERVAFFEQLIKDGKQPVIVLLGVHAEYPAPSQTEMHIYYDSEINFLLDGHHKLLAYQRLKQPPRVINIIKIIKEEIVAGEHLKYESLLYLKERNHIKNCIEELQKR